MASPKSQIYWLHDVSKKQLIEMGVQESSIHEQINIDGLTQCKLTEKQAHSLIPKNTMYCYKRLSDGKYIYCPFWDRIEQFPYQNNGYCHFLRKGDDSLGGLLWDQCKECGVSDDHEEPDWGY